MSKALKRGINEKENVAMELLYGAMIVCPRDEDVRNYMIDAGYDISEGSIRAYRKKVNYPNTSFFEAFQKRREKMAPILEAKLTNDLLSEAGRMTAVIDFCVQQTEEQLALGEIKDTARTARDLAQVRTQAIDKRQLLKGQPTAIIETRTVDEMINALEGMHVVTRVDAETTAIEETADGS